MPKQLQLNQKNEKERRICFSPFVLSNKSGQTPDNCFLTRKPPGVQKLRVRACVCVCVLARVNVRERERERKRDRVREVIFRTVDAWEFLLEAATDKIFW